MLDTHINAFLIGNHLKLLSMKSRAGGYLWEVESLAVLCPCLRCGSVSTVKAGKATTTVREEPVRNVSVWMKIHKHRYYCKDCKKTFTEPIQGIWPKKRSTQRFRRFIG